MAIGLVKTAYVATFSLFPSIDIKRSFAVCH
jgi:hypothetical protein